ncbi:D-aminoacylase [Limnohabitans sp. T6-5]|uniref:N-acyl-D-amino-acid deacylase family protein n=1 Tax=Limnohabitans sp. T6-5 TaxID=1100724 RepID=UPI000D35AEBE|nr:D-aminoacylase [Limnohabitans sp. T6-5]PUE06831.1 D-aminoacylase [Limnohabitans sp. T6-5]
MKSLLLRNTQLVDGTGAPARPADLCVQGERIVAIGENLTLDADEILDIKGLTVAPGFIDVHTHDDAMVLRDPSMLAKLSQGVTTVITGNCGLSLVPLISDTPGSPLDLLHTSEFRFAQLNDYAKALEKKPPAVNVGALIGHTTLRATVMADLNRAATPDESKAMAALLDQALNQGALGLSSGLFYQQAFAADMQEMQTLVRVVGRHGAVYVTHIRNEMDDILEAMQEAADTALAGPATWIMSHHKCAGPRNWGRTIETLAMLERLSHRQSVGTDVYPYSAGSTLLREDLVDGVIDILITRSDTHPEMAGRYLADIAQEWRTDQRQACRRLMPGGACYFQMREDDVRRVLTHPLSMIGSDGLPHDERPHPRLWGSFARVLGHYCRDEKLFSLPEAIHKMTGMSAQRFGLIDRGVLREGGFADLVVLDPGLIQDKATYEQPQQMCEGIERVMVNGQWSFADQQVQGPTAGKFLRRLIQSST